MKVDYQKTFTDLKEKGLIQDGDKYTVCLFQPETQNNGVTSTIITSKFDYVMAVNNDELKLFDIDKRTGEYLGKYLVFKKSDIIFTKKIKERRFIWASRGLFGGMYIAIHFIPENFIHSYVIPKKLHGFEQKEARLELYNFVKETYNTYFNEQKQLYKNSK